MYKNEGVEFFESNLTPMPVDTEAAENPEAESVVLGNLPEVDTNNGEMNVTINIPEVLEEILRKFSYEELLEFRSVSNLWNEESIRLLLMRPEYQKVEKKSWDWLNNDFEDELCTLLKNCKHPTLLLKDVELCVSSGWKCHNLIETDKQLRAYGVHIKSLKIREDANLHVFQKLLLLDNCYCPDVEALDFRYYQSEGSLPNFVKGIQQIQLKLKELQFTPVIMRNKYMPPGLAVLRFVLRNSPHLVSLKIDGSSCTEIRSCFQLLATLPQVTKNLSTFCIRRKVVQNLKELCKVEFSDQLKTVKFTPIYRLRASQDPDRGIEPDPKEQDEDVKAFLKHVGQSLETFHYRLPGGNKRLYNLPTMPNLKELILFWYSLDLNEEQDFFDRVPSLKILNTFKLDGIHEFVEHASKSNKVYKNVEEMNRLSSGGRHNRYYLFVPVPKTVSLLGQVFPNLTELRMETQLREDPSLDEQRILFEEFFHAVSQLKNLKSFAFLDDLDLPPEDASLDLTLAFRYLKELPDLEKLCFRREGEQRNDFPKETWLMEIIDAPKLREIAFFRYIMETHNNLDVFRNETVNEKKMREVYAKRGITFTIGRH